MQSDCSRIERLPDPAGLGDPVKAELPADSLDQFEQGEHGVEFEYIHLVAEYNMLERTQTNRRVQQHIHLKSPYLPKPERCSEESRPTGKFKRLILP